MYGNPSSLHFTGIINVSRPKFSNWLLIGRQARKTAHQSPSFVWIKSAWPAQVTELGRSEFKCLCVRIGLFFHGRNLPIGESPRKITSECQFPVPPSADIKKYFPFILYKWGPSIQIGLSAGWAPLFTRILRGPIVLSVFTSNSCMRIVRCPLYSGLLSGASSLLTIYALPSSSKKKEGSIPPTSGNMMGSDHSPNGSCVLTKKFPAPTLVVTI